MRHLIVHFALAAGTIAAASALPAGSGSAADKPKMFDLTSSDFRDGGLLPHKSRGNNPANKNCNGQNISPELSWSNPPEKTQSYAIVLYDPVGRAPLGVVHWLAYDIPASRKGFKEGETSKPATDWKTGKSTIGVPTYFGPCSSAGDKPHPYVFTLIATDLAPGTLDAGLTREDLAPKLQGHILGATSLVARSGY